jgi:RNA polymerase sigma factor (sigma-70 family)
LQDYSNIQNLISALQQKDQKAFAHLYDNYSGALYGIIFKIVNNEDDANDVLQEAFINIWKSIETYDAKKGGTLFTWMLNIARNKAIDKYRQKNRIGANQKEIYIVGIGNEHTNNSSTKIDSIGMHKLINKIKPELQYFKGLTHQEITEITNLPLGTVKTRLRTAMTELKQVFGAS